MEEEKNRLNQDHVDADEGDEEEDEEEEEEEEEETIMDRLSPQKKRKYNTYVHLMQQNLLQCRF